jgi:RimJ/RimL family protein N-acetyltransferase
VSLSPPVAIPNPGTYNAAVTEVVGGDGLRLRRATADDVDFLLEVETDEDVEPFLEAGLARTREEVVEEIERQRETPRDVGRLVIEVERNSAWSRAGTMSFEVVNRRSRIARLGRLAVHPHFRGQHLSDAAARLLQRHLLFELDYHRLEVEIYGFNRRAQHHAERSGFVREGVRRKAYWRDGEWVDGVVYGLVREDLDG